MAEPSLEFRNDPEIENARRVASIATAEHTFSIDNSDLPLSGRIEHLLAEAHRAAMLEPSVFEMIYRLNATQPLGTA